MIVLFLTTFKYGLQSKSKLHNAFESILFISKLTKEVFLHQVKLGAVKEKVFIIINASSTHANRATAINFVPKSMLIQWAEVHTHLLIPSISKIS